MKIRNKKLAFTLSEVVITLIVIGVVSAITIPMLHNGVNDKKWNVARQKAQATIGEAFKLMTVNGEIERNTSTADFVNKVLPQYLKLEKTCAANDYDKCGFPKTIKTADGTTVSNLEPKDFKWTTLSDAYVISSPAETTGGWGTKTRYPHSDFNLTYFFRTLDGFSVGFLYNPYCASDERDYKYYIEIISGNTYNYQLVMDAICLMGIYDMNGKQGPNKVGMDIGFVGSFYNGFETSAATVLPHSKEKKHNESGMSGSTSWDRLNNYCNSLGKNRDWILPGVDDLSLIYLNYKLVSNQTNSWRYFPSREFLANTGHFRGVYFHNSMGGTILYNPRNYSDSAVGPFVRCVRRNSMT